MKKLNAKTFDYYSDLCDWVNSQSNITLFNIVYRIEMIIIMTMSYFIITQQIMIQMKYLNKLYI